MFTDKEIEDLQHYVYFLVDPRDPDDEKIFYVGKGQGNRVFEHVEHANDKEWENERLDTIREIEREGHQVKSFIARHGMDNNTAFEAEAALIDILLFLDRDSLKNDQRGHGSPKRGLWDFQGHIPKNKWGLKATLYR